jgi:hypothetical protein
MRKSLAANQPASNGTLRQKLSSLSSELDLCMNLVEDFSRSMTSESVDYKRKLNSFFHQKNGALTSVNSRLILSEKNVEALRSEAIAVRQLLDASERARAALEQTSKRGTEVDSLKLNGYSESRSAPFLMQRNSIQPHTEVSKHCFVQFSRSSRIRFSQST